MIDNRISKYIGLFSVVWTWFVYLAVGFEAAVVFILVMIFIYIDEVE